MMNNPISGDANIEFDSGSAIPLRAPSPADIMPELEDTGIVHIPTRVAIVGDNLKIHRALPSKQKRLIGAWCFLDHAGPTTFKEGEGFSVGPHPHIGLQTFTWMIEGEIYHQDSLGYQQIIRPNEINLMTAGHGISHIERSPEGHSPHLHLAQLWIALPKAQCDMPPSFEHYESLPVIEQNNCRFTLLAGEFLGQTSPVKVYSDMMGVDIHALVNTSTVLPLNPNYEYGILLLQGELSVEQDTLDTGTLLYFQPGQHQLHLELKANTRLLLIGGKPFEEDIIIWWNFVGRSTEEIQQAAHDWINQSRFGQVAGFEHERLTIPAIPDNLKASR
jgi:quercetin 2,3-dioxygenase